MKPFVPNIFSCLLLALFWANSTVAMEENSYERFRSFMSNDGRSVDARIIEYDAKQSRVEVECRNKKKMWVAPDVFSETDQVFIKEWIAANKFLSTTTLGLSIERTEKRAFNRYESVEYCLMFNNITDETIDIYGFELLCEVDHKENSSTETLWAYRKSIYAYKVNPGKSTQPLPGPLYLDEQEHDESIRSVWVRLQGPTLDGEIICREVLLPEKRKIKNSWEKTQEISRLDVLNPYLPKKPETTRIAGAKPANEQEYSKWFTEIRQEGDFYMHSRPVLLDKAKEAYAELKALYNPKYETTGSHAVMVARLAYMVCDYKGTVEWYETAIGIDNKKYCRTTLCALYSSGISGVTDGKKALTLAKALVAEFPDDVECNDLLARAYARAGQYDLAIETQKRVIELRKEKLEKKYWEANLIQYRKRLELYEQGKPYYDCPPDGFS